MFYLEDEAKTGPWKMVSAFVILLPANIQPSLMSGEVSIVYFLARRHVLCPKVQIISMPTGMKGAGEWLCLSNVLS